MKKLALYTLLSIVIVSCQNQEKIRTLTVTVDDSINKDAQWVYWFSLHDNEYNIIDSCFIEKGQTEFILRDSVMNDSVSQTELIFSEVFLPWEYSTLYIDKNDRNIKINNLTIEGIDPPGTTTTVTGTLAHTEIRGLFYKRASLRKKMVTLKDDIFSADYNDTITIKKIMKQISEIEKSLNKNYLIAQFDSVKSTSTIEYLLIDLDIGARKGEISTKTSDSIVRLIEKRYPSDTKISEAIRIYIREGSIPPPSPKSEYWTKRKEEITYFAYNKEIFQSTDGNVLSRQPKRPSGVYRVDPDTTNIPAYTIGSKVSNLKLKDIKGNIFSLSQIKTDYILIDFWATWCIPCVREIPGIKATHDKYKNVLSIYAISLDNSAREWRNSIEKYEMREFLNVYAGTWANEDVRLLTNSFGITSIPANFLLDKERKIIAQNLTGHELEIEFRKLVGKK